MAHIDTPIATDFLARCFAPGDTVALLIRRDNPLFVLQRIVSLENTLAPRYLGWLAHENATGANVYVAANPLRIGSRQRTKESVASVRHLYIDIDIDGDARLTALRASDVVPTPTAILSTSQGKYQVLWRVDGFDFERQERTLKLLAIAFGGDPACTDCNRVLRIPGFLNWKYDLAQLVTVEYPCDSVLNPDDFRLEIPALEAGLSAPVTVTESILESTQIRNGIGRGFCMNFPREKTPQSSRVCWQSVAPISPTLSYAEYMDMPSEGANIQEKCALKGEAVGISSGASFGSQCEPRR